MATAAQQEAVAAVTGIASAAVSAGTSTAASGAVAALLSAAGASAAVPFAGWIAAGAAATAAGVIALVGSLKRGRIRRQEAVDLAKRLGFEDAAAIPRFVVRAFQLPASRLDRIGARLERKIRRERSGRTRWRKRLKLQLIGTIRAFQEVERRASPSAALVAPAPPATPPAPSAGPLLVGSALVVLLLFISASQE
jgi:hypothetical protein